MLALMTLDDKVTSKTIKLLQKRLAYLIKQSEFIDKNKLLELNKENPYAVCSYILDNENSIPKIIEDTIQAVIEIITVNEFVDSPTITDLTDNSKAFYYGTMLLNNKKITPYEYMSNRDNFYAILQEDVV